MSTASRRWADLSTAEVPTAVGPGSLVVLPVGAVEPHGPHLPMSTDAVMAAAVASAVVERSVAAGHDLWLLPTLSVTKSDEHSALPGTLWLNASTLFATMVDLGRSLAASGVRRLLIVNGHGGNSALLEVALRELRRRFDLRTFLVSSPPTPGETEFGMGIHAGWSETSMMLHVAPELVSMDAAAELGPKPAAAVASGSHVGFGRTVKFGWLSTDFDASGVVGDPTGATAEAGERLFEDYVTSVVDAVPEILTFNPGAL
ncbi:MULTISPECIES: creatininase family protein [Corynebacterium]|uniref:Mycofactocin system creatinine amidohydrolase family protein MftE n=1 Tax=Corynebacterium provencense TaxID=1737425 RepID=A0A2Z3YN31_9CORY|nr:MULTISPECIES: creatininase family protein [Corynebacterium]AWT25129.1 Putative mycofactocin system creatinine amidohydrolase family protein MftE [Corynebacterium provencense]MCI1255612.1 creatininase family protein [Corynebacterium provencense]